MISGRRKKEEKKEVTFTWEKQEEKARNVYRIRKFARMKRLQEKDR